MQDIQQFKADSIDHDAHAMSGFAKTITCCCVILDTMYTAAKTLKLQLFCYAWDNYDYNKQLQASFY